MIWFPTTAVAADPAALAVASASGALTVAVAVAAVANDPAAALAAPGAALDRTAAAIRLAIDEVRIEWAGAKAWLCPPGHGHHRAGVLA